MPGLLDKSDGATSRQGPGYYSSQLSSDDIDWNARRVGEEQLLLESSGRRFGTPVLDIVKVPIVNTHAPTVKG
jgi:hypothetical protein